ncbi:MAG: protein kinase [Propionibacteriaceae bacterium]|jgi:serine/threonine protein kinase|nr:protein kinase [Propionibacteriaceae bacterium]
MAMVSVPQAPAIPGLIYQSFLGSGGFADVFLYQSTSPQRLVAVKVLHAVALTPAVINRFASEANTMAALEHPHIVRVYSSGVTPDGRPYIEMAYYAGGTLAVAVANHPLAVADVLRAGIQLASAIETAHQVGLLHRDIKPSNVLVDRFGDVALTDFGIASRIHELDDDEAALSVPWAAPEAMFASAPLDARADVYSLAATCWHLLVGHSPFDLPGTPIKSSALMVRVRDLPAPLTGRADLPPDLESLLHRAMAKDPRQRPSSAYQFGLALAQCERQLGLPPTPFKVAEPRPGQRPSGGPGARIVAVPDGLVASIKPAPGAIGPTPQADRRQFGSLVQPGISSASAGSAAQRLVDPASGQAPQSISGVANPDSAFSVVEAPTIARGAAKPVGTDWPSPLLAQSDRVEPSLNEAEPAANSFWQHTGRIIVVTIIIVALVGAVLAWRLFAPEPPDDRPTISAPPVPPEDILRTYPGPAQIEAQVDGTTIHFSWEYQRQSDDDIYYLSVDDAPAYQADQPTVDVPYDGQEVCLAVRIARSNGAYAQIESEQLCAG